ncbi:hypothetical protein DFH27DRAFT_605296 [Peziza echinospora]|nr:hypothetical protein DFH27DRAFT_605296 [Peziza echinospora]
MASRSGLFSDVPIEVIFRVLSELNPSDLINLRLVDKTHYQIFTLDIVCREAIKVFYRDCRELRMLDKNENKSRKFDLGDDAGRILFDKIYRRRTRFLSSCPTKVVKIGPSEGKGARTLFNVSTHIDEQDLMYTVIGGPKTTLTIRNLNNHSEQNVVVPLFETLPDGSGPIFNSGRQSSNLEPWRRLRYPKAIVAAQDGRIMLATTQYGESAEQETTQLAVLSTEKDTRGQVVQIWRPRWPLSEAGETSLAAVNRHYAVYKIDIHPQRALGRAGAVWINIIPLLSHDKHGTSKRLNDEDKKTYIRAIYSQSENSLSRDAVGADHDGKFFFNASRIKMTVEVYSVPDFTTDAQPIRVAIIPLFDPDNYWKVHLNVNYEACRETDSLRNASTFHILPFQKRDTISFTLKQHLKQIPRHNCMGSETAATYTIPLTLDGINDLFESHFSGSQQSPWTERLEGVEWAEGLEGRDFLNLHVEELRHTPYHNLLLKPNGFIPLITPNGGPLGFLYNTEPYLALPRKLAHNMDDYRPRRYPSATVDRGGDALPTILPTPLPEYVPSGYFAHPGTLPHHMMETCSHDYTRYATMPHFTNGREIFGSRLMNRIRLPFWDKGRNGRGRDFGGKVGVELDPSEVDYIQVDYTWLWPSTNDWYVDLHLTGQAPQYMMEEAEEDGPGDKKEKGKMKLDEGQDGHGEETTSIYESVLLPRNPREAVQIPPVNEIDVNGVGDGWVVFSSNDPKATYIVRYD